MTKRCGTTFTAGGRSEGRMDERKAAEGRCEKDFSVVTDKRDVRLIGCYSIASKYRWQVCVGDAQSCWHVIMDINGF